MHTFEQTCVLRIGSPFPNFDVMTGM